MARGECTGNPDTILKRRYHRFSVFVVKVLVSRSSPKVRQRFRKGDSSEISEKMVIQEINAARIPAVERT